jgi:myosin heavy subunit
MDYQALMMKYEEDIAYYKDLVGKQQEQSPIDLSPFSDPSSSIINERIMQELKESEEHYIKQQQEYQKYIRELEGKVHGLEEEIQNQNNSHSIVFEDSRDPEEDLRILIESLEEQVKGMKEALKIVENDLEDTRQELGSKTYEYDQLSANYDEILMKYEDAQEVVKRREKEIAEWKEKYFNDTTKLKMEIDKKDDFYQEKIKNQTLEAKEKDILIKSLTKQLEDDEDMCDIGSGNPFMTSSSNDMEDSSLFDELGGEMARSFSMCPSNFKNLAKHLKKHVKVLEAKFQTLKSENKILQDEK